MKQDRPCWLCGDQEAEVLELMAGKQTFLVACAVCLAQALETLTGYGFVGQLAQWRALTEYHARQRAERGRGIAVPRGARYSRSEQHDDVKVHAAPIYGLEDDR